jgi:hypothetical protein
MPHCGKLCELWENFLKVSAPIKGNRFKFFTFDNLYLIGIITTNGVDFPHTLTSKLLPKILLLVY